MIDTAAPPAPPTGALGRIPTEALQSTLVVGGAAMVFLLARGLVWARPVSLEDLDLLALGALPAVAYLTFGRSEGSAYRSMGVLAWGWVLSLVIYIALHAAHRFEEFEGPIRAAFEPGVARYVVYGGIYSLAGVAFAALGRRLLASMSFSAASLGTLAAGSVVNAVYFGIALFMFQL